jgi:putative ABC transport system permease protein
MKHYLELVPISAKAHKKQSRMTRLCIVLAVFLVTAIFGMADMEIRSQKLQAIQTDGAWHVAFRDITQEQADMIAARPDVASSSWYGALNYRLDDNYTVDGRQVGICGFDASFPDLMPAAAVAEGTFPTEGQALLTQDAKEQLGLSLGDTFSLNLPDGSSRCFTVSGFVANLGMLTKSDATGVFVNTEDFRSLCIGMGKEDAARSYYVQFAPGVRVNPTAEAITAQLGLSEKQVQENTKLLGIIGQSKDSYMMSLYGVAAVLAVLVVAAGILMIASSLNANVANRTEYFGLLRCLGATPRQVMRFVRLEALSWCITAIPLGVAGAIAVIWALCAMLKATSPRFFASMPAFGISGMSILAGVVIGFATVFLAATRPARRAAKCSPLAAVSGNAEAPQSVRHAADTKRFSIEAVLGMHHATGSKKNYLLMSGSFALSIILFLSFTTAVDFMHHAIRPLSPYTPDVSIISTDNTCSISRNLLDSISAVSGVKHAYGRSFSYEVPAQSAGKPLKVNLISYEETQFGWAKGSLVEGNVQDAQDGDGVLIVYDESSPLCLGDVVTADFGTGAQDIPVAGILSDSPFSREEGIETLICSESTFMRLTGRQGYTILDIQLTGGATDKNVAQMRALAGDGFEFSDQRLNNQEVRAAFYSFALFVYGFLFLIALISAFAIVNSIAMSVSARTRQYGAMRAIGMSDGQLRSMVLYEAATYAVSGIVLGCLAGVPLNRILFETMVTSRWGDAWHLPVAALAIIIAAVAVSSLAAVLPPVKRLQHLSIVETIRAE